MSDGKVVADPVGAFVCSLDSGQGNGPLAGLRFGVKDLFDVAGVATGSGHPLWAETHELPQRTAPAVQCLLGAGARLVGKTHTDELAYSLAGANPHYGAPVNVNAPGRRTGGSSSGSAAATAAGLVDFALGTDTGGSVRIPASQCGLFGIRTSHGRIPLDGVTPLAPGFDTCGWFARDATTLARVGEALLGTGHGLLQPQSLWLPRDVLAALDPDVATILARAQTIIAQRLGVAFEHEAVAEGEALADWAALFRVQQGFEAWQAHGDWIQRYQPTFGDDVAARFRWAASVTRADYTASVARTNTIRERLAERLGSGRIVLLPGAPDIAPAAEASPEAVQGFREQAMQQTCIAGLGGLPQVVVPWTERDQCPLGVGLAAAHGRDEGLLALVRDRISDLTPAP